MTERIIGLVLDESHWLPLTMVVSAIVVVAQARRHRLQGVPRKSSTLCGLNLFYGSMLGIMASGHILAVTVTAVQGTLQRSPWFLYPLGLALALPAWWLVVAGGRLRGAQGPTSRTAMALNAWLGIGLMAIGPQNWPLAAPSVLNIAYRFQVRPAVRLAIVSVVGVGYLALLAGALVFLASGQTFEQFQGMTN